MQKSETVTEEIVDTTVTKFFHFIMLIYILIDILIYFTSVNDINSISM